MAEREITIECPECPGLAMSAVYQADKDGKTAHKTTGLLSAVEQRHALSYPGHAVSYRVETLEAAVSRRTEDARVEAQANAEAGQMIAERERQRLTETKGSVSWPF